MLWPSQNIWTLYSRVNRVKSFLTFHALFLDWAQLKAASYVSLEKYAARNSSLINLMQKIFYKELQHIAIGGNSRVASWIIKQIASITMQHLWFIKQSTVCINPIY